MKAKDQKDGKGKDRKFQHGARWCLERMARVYDIVRGGKYPNARKIADELEVCTKTVYRDLEFLRDWMCVPMRYNPQHFGYELEAEAVLPFWNAPWRYDAPPVLEEVLLLAACGCLVGFRAEDGRYFETWSGDEIKQDKAIPYAWQPLPPRVERQPRMDANGRESKGCDPEEHPFAGK